jgi:hypothetical protein
MRFCFRPLQTAAERAALWKEHQEKSKGVDLKSEVVADYMPKKRQTSFKVKKVQEEQAKQV